MALWKAQWDELITLCGNGLFLAGPTQIRHEGTDMVLAVHKARAVATTLAWLVILSVVVVALSVGAFLLWSSPKHREMVPIVIMSVVAVGGVFGIASLLRRLVSLAVTSRQVRLSTSRKQITFVLDGRELTFPAAGLAIRFTRITDMRNQRPARVRGKWYIGWPYHLEVFAADGAGDAGHCLWLANADAKRKLQPAFALLRSLLGGAVDGTLRRVTLQDGGDVFVDDEALKGGANFSTRVLVFRTDALAVVKPSLGVRIFFGIFLAVGLGIIAVGLTQTASFESVWHAALIVGFGCCFGLPGALGILGVFGAPPVVIDTSRGTISMPGGKKVPTPELITGMPLKQLAALQLCTYIVTSKNSSTTMYELNAILRGPDGLRIPLINDSRRPRLETQAQRLMHMLRLPMIDSTGKTA
ncbi:MAG: hypothetical protein FWE88_08225 [Phycisphaerae bacterium]|nr:hypothetical protein [Phycisphaerae bacterium]